MDKIKVAFIKYGGLSAGGTERFLHAIAVNLPKDRFEVDYYYTDGAPYLGSNWKHPDTDPERKKYVESGGVNVIKVDVQYKDVRTRMHDWVNTNIWELFDENKYDIVMGGRAGHPEFPFNMITKTPIVNILTLIAGVDNQRNVFKSIQISNWAGEQWVNRGGDKTRLEIIPIVQEMPKPPFTNMREELGLQDKFIYGFHQRNSEGIFSEVPLQAYKEIEDDSTCFILLGGNEEYKTQAKNLGLKNFIALPHTGDSNVIHNFLETIDVFSHGRNDGETFGAVFTEAMYHKKPCISHTSRANGHVEVMGPGGTAFGRGDIKGYSDEMLKLKNDSNYYSEKANAGYEHYNVNYSLESQMDRLISILEAAKKHGKYI
jgi:hypothetical protein